MDLPDGMNIKVSVIDSDVVNAFATLDGNVVFFTGLLNMIPNENTLAMVMAHEIAHIKLRHPLRALGRGVVVGIAIATITGISGNDIVAGFIGNTSLLTALSFSREQESAADNIAVAALVKHYGHAGGAAQLFEVFDKVSDKAKNIVPEFFATHPLNQNRTELIEKQAHRNGWSLQGKLGDLPAPVIKELKRLHEENEDSEKTKK